MTRRIILYSAFAAMLLFFACDEKAVFVNCSECVADEPTTADVHLKLESETGDWVKVTVFIGVIEDGIVVDSFTTESVDYTFNGQVNTKYTFTAEYLLSSGKTIIAVDTAWPRVKFEKNQCQNPCYFVYDNNVNLRIKYH